MTYFRDPKWFLYNHAIIDTAIFAKPDGSSDDGYFVSNGKYIVLKLRLSQLKTILRFYSDFHLRNLRKQSISEIELKSTQYLLIAHRYTQLLTKRPSSM
jgi:hypothetical protein